jgi:arylsulfatase A-like enzyme
VILSWHLIAVIAAVLTARDLKSVLTKCALPFIPFLVIVVAADPAKATLGQTLLRIPQTSMLFSGTTSASARVDLLFLTMASAPTLLLFLATALDMVNKSTLRPVRSLVRPLTVVSLMLLVAAFTGWRHWRDAAFLRGEADSNILFIICDAMRPDHLGCYGYHRNTTPFLDELAKEGVVFTNFIAASSWSLPSYSAMYASRYPSYYNDSVVRRSRRENTLNTASMMAEQWYYTKSFLTNPYAAKPYGTSTNLAATLDFSGGGRTLTNLAAGLLARHADKRLFVHVQYMDPHEPYVPPKPYDRLFVGPDALYDGEIAHLDFQISRLIGQLKELGIYENTYIVLTADHGQGLEGSRAGHGYSLGGELLRVPLIVRGPDIPRGKRIDEPASHVDLLPTFLEWVRGKPDVRCQGKSLMAIINGGESESRVVFSELYYPHDGRTPPEHHFISVQKGAWKLITGGPEGDVLFNVREDPSESINLAAEEQQVFASLKAEIDRFVSDMPEERATFAQFTYTRNELEALKHLGYLQ